MSGVSYATDAIGAERAGVVAAARERRAKAVWERIVLVTNNKSL